MPSVFCFYSRSPRRQEIITHDQRPPELSYLFYGADRYHRYGWAVDNNLLHPPSAKVHILGDVITRILFRVKGYGGDFATVMANLKYANKADVVFSTVDTVGIPLALFRHFKILRRPLVYMSIGLVERLDNMAPSQMKRLQLRSFNSCSVMAGYGFKEVEQLQERIGPGPHYRFVPYGVDFSYLEKLRPMAQINRIESSDVLSMGMDFQRDFSLLNCFARRNPKVRIKIITTLEECRKLHHSPENITCCGPLPLPDLLKEIVAAKIVALPVKENGYSGGTTSLLQSMALGKPVVVTETGAISKGYGFVDFEHLRFTPPGDEIRLAVAIEQLLADEINREQMALRGQSFIRKNHGWERFISDLTQLFGQAHA